MTLLEQHATPDIIKLARGTDRRAVTSEQLAIALYVIERNSTTRHLTPFHQFTAPNNQFIQALKTLSHPLSGKEPSQRRAVSIIKKILIAAGLVTEQDRNWYAGKGKCYGLGPNHPRQPDFLKLKASIQPE